MKPESHKLAVIARSVGVNPCAVYEIFRRIRKAVMDEGGEVITHELGTFFRSERSQTRKVLNGVEYLIPARTCLALSGVKGPGLDQMEANDLCSTELIDTGSIAIPSGTTFIDLSGRVEVMPGTRLVIKHDVLPPALPGVLSSIFQPYSFSWTTTFSSQSMIIPEVFIMRFGGGFGIPGFQEYQGVDEFPSMGDVIEIEILFLERIEESIWDARISSSLNGEVFRERVDRVDRCNVNIRLASLDQPINSSGATMSSQITPNIGSATVSIF